MMKQKTKKYILIITCLWTALSLSACAVINNSVYKAGLRLERFRSGMDMKPHTLDIERHQIYYLEGGTGNEETIVLVHGFSADKDMWCRFAKYLIDGYRVISLDLPGHGDSSSDVDDNYGIKIQAERLNRIVDGLGLKRFHLLGSSMGGAIATRYAYGYPERVKTLGLMSAAGVMPPQASELQDILINKEKNDNPLIMRKKGDFKRLLNFTMVDPPFIPWPISAAARDNYIAREKINDKIFNDIVLDIVHMEILPDIKAPTLIIWGSEDRCVHISCVKVFEDNIPETDTVIMENVGHAPMFEKPKESAAHYLKFLKAKKEETGG